jgi:hypothetical protein
VEFEEQRGGRLAKEEKQSRKIFLVCAYEKLVSTVQEVRPVSEGGEVGGAAFWVLEVGVGHWLNDDVCVCEG